MAGVSNLWWVPLANTYGRRPIMLLSLLAFTLCSVWCAKATSFDSLLVARLFLGVSIGPSDTVCPDIIGEVFFVHQRGRAMAIYTLFLALGSSTGGLSGSYIASALGWRWTFWISVILAGANLVLAAVVLPETLFDRDSRPRQDITTSVSDKAGEKDVSTEEHEVGSSSTYGFARSLTVGVNRGGLGKQFIRPWLSLRFPGVWLVMLQYGGLVGGLVTISAVGPTIVSMPPYLWIENASLVNVGGVIGTIIGALFTYFGVDRIVERHAHRDEMGLAEPESRLPIMIPALFLSTTGLWVFGFCAQNPGAGRWVGLEVGLGMVAFGIMQAPAVGFSYVSHSRCCDKFHPPSPSPSSVIAVKVTI